MADRANPHDAVPDFEMTPGVPGNGGDAVTEPDAVAIQPLRDLERAVPDLPVVGALDRPLDRSRADPLFAIDRRRVLDDPVAQQGPLLHQTKNADIPPERVSPLHLICRQALRDIITGLS